MSYNEQANETMPQHRLLSKRLILFAAAVRQATSGEVLSRKLGAKVTDAQADALRFLILNENVTVGEIAVGLGHTISGATKAVNRLEANEWVERFNRGDDHRTVYVRLTKRGRELADDLISETELRLNRILQRLRPDTVEKLDRILEAFLRDFIDDGEIATKLCIACGFEGGIHCCESDVDCVVAKTVQQIEPEKDSVR
ncbi:MAG: MarR family transcriptional regulator [Candidatus Omnitrophica bacterium]|nr:MarR family transcriptional regulator [Candidatus Omnitrophota bacterium]